MAETRLKGLLGIDVAPLPVGGGVPATGDWVSAGVTYRDEATLTEDDPTETEHFSNENDDPEESDMATGKKKISFALIDYTPSNLVKWFGGTASGTGATLKWEAPATRSKVEMSVRLKSKNGNHYITFPRVSLFAKVDYKLAPSGIAKILVTGVVLTPTGSGVSSMIKGVTA